MCFYYITIFLKQTKKRAARFASNSSMPLRHVGNIVIWEGNYTPDIPNIAMKLPFLDRKVCKKIC